MTRKIFILITLLLISLAQLTEVQAQQNRYTKFEIDAIQLGYVPVRGGSIGAELRFNLRDNISIGYGSQIRINSNTDSEALRFAVTKSNMLSADYYFNTSSTRRLFSGLGLGHYEGGSFEYGTRANGQEYHTGRGGKSFGLAPRLGYELGHFRIKAQYNAIFRKEVDNFFDLSFALTLGGGIRK